MDEDIRLGCRVAFLRDRRLSIGNADGDRLVRVGDSDILASTAVAVPLAAVALLRVTVSFSASRQVIVVGLDVEAQIGAKRSIGVSQVCRRSSRRQSRRPRPAGRLGRGDKVGIFSRRVVGSRHPR